MGLLEDFATFLEEYGSIGLAIALIIGLVVTDIVNALVEDVVMPIIALFFPGGDWQNVTWTLVSIEFLVGHFLAALVDFLIIAFLIFLFVRYLLSEAARSRRGRKTNRERSPIHRLSWSRGTPRRTTSPGVPAASREHRR